MNSGVVNSQTGLSSPLAHQRATDATYVDPVPRATSVPKNRLHGTANGSTLGLAQEQAEVHASEDDGYLYAGESPEAPSKPWWEMSMDPTDSWPTLSNASPVAEQRESPALEHGRNTSTISTSHPSAVSPIEGSKHAAPKNALEDAVNSTNDGTSGERLAPGVLIPHDSSGDDEYIAIEEQLRQGNEGVTKID
jgi:hypothetical protein